MNNSLYIPQEKDFPEILNVWEKSVRATHHFLQEEDIQLYKKLIFDEYLKAVNLICIRNQDNQILGFLGTDADKIEMLFIHPDNRGQGIGKKLLEYAIHNLKTDKVDVNEQNEQAVGFYKKSGFKIIDRSELDGMGKAYPLLHMKL